MEKFKLVIESWLKTFLTVCIVLIMNHGSIWNIDWKEFVNSAIMSLLPIVYNFLNPSDPRYGIVKKNDIVYNKPNGRNLNGILLIIVMSVLFSSCSAPFQAGGWIVPLLPLIGATYFGIQWRKQNSDVNKFATIAFSLAFIGVLIWMWTAA